MPDITISQLGVIYLEEELERLHTPVTQGHYWCTICKRRAYAHEGKCPHCGRIDGLVEEP